jgi:acyl-CoA thioesterase-2
MPHCFSCENERVTAPDQEPLDGLLKLLDIEPLEETLFRGLSPDTSVQRVFGGQVAGQALVAAGRTVEPQRRVHSLHAYFLHAGDPAVPLIYSVDVTRNTRTMSTRRVTATQHGRAVFVLTASFMVPEPGIEHQDAMPSAPDPEGLMTFEERFAPLAEMFPNRRRMPRPIDLRYVDDPPFLAALKGTAEVRPPDSQVWLRAAGTLPDDPLLHVCVLAYASDMTLLDSVLAPHGIDWTGKSAFIASLDHAMWFHGEFRADEWLLYDQHSPWAGDARGLAVGSIYTQSGRRVCSVVQEGLVRRPR